MVEFIINVKYYFILFIFPLIGLIIDLKLTEKTRLVLLISSLIILSPALFNYRYTINYIYQIFGILLLGSGYSFILSEIITEKKKIIKSITSTIILFFIIGFFTFISAFGGSLTIEQEWQTDEYKIQYTKDQGFAGGPAMGYKLNKYSTIPFLIKTVEKYGRKDSLNNCIIHFYKNNIQLDKCNDEIKKTIR